MRAAIALSGGAVKAAGFVGAAAVRGLSTAAAPATAVRQPTLRELLPAKPRKVVKKGTRRLPNIRPQEVPYVADHTVVRATTVAPPGTSLASVTVLGKPLRPDLASGVRAEASAGGAGGTGGASDGGVAHRFDDSTASASSASASSSSGSSSSGPSSGPSSGSDTEGVAAAGSSGSSRRAPAALDDDAAPASAAATASPRAADGSPRRFAVIGLGGTQYKVTAGDLINAERLPGVQVGELLTVTDVRVVGTAARTVLGRPTVPGAAVRCVVEEHALDRKIVVFKKRRRKRYQRTAGHRRMVTRLRVQEVACDLEAF